VLDGGVAGQQIIDYINAHGGAGCHKLAQVKYAQNLTDSQSSADQAACTKFTRDAKVPIVAQVTVPTPTFYECLARAGVSQTASAHATPDQAFHMKYANFVFSTQPSEERAGKTLAAELDRNGYFHDAGGVYAVIYEDHPWFKSQADAFVAQAKSYGVKIVAVDGLCNPDTAPNNYQSCDTAQNQNEVVKLQALRVNHIALLGTTLGPFKGSMAQQNYYPRLGLTTQSGGYLCPNCSASSLNGAVGIGYFPAYDVLAAQDTPPHTSAYKLCHEIIFGGGDPPSRIAEAQGDGECDTFFLIAAILNASHGNTSPEAVRAGLESLGSSFVAAATWSTSFGPAKHDGGDVYHPYIYSQDCACMTYGPEAFPILKLAGQ
jgi:ABC-type branched-subunit amino acid transport system substrate-binding protein